MSWGFAPAKLPKELHKKLVDMGVHQLILNWQGGDDQGELEIEFRMAEHFATKDGVVENYPVEKVEETLRKDVMDWAYDAHHYNGAGDGNYYGDDVTYDFEKNEVTHQEWYNETVRQDGGYAQYPFAEMQESVL